jgi:probable rRNA maturation factor
MLLDKIEIESEFTEVLDLINVSGLSSVFEELQLTKPVLYYIISDDELLEVNIESLGHDYYTDIITFDYGDDDDIEQHEILVSWDRVKENAVSHNQTNFQELHRVCIHGLLHLAGYNDESTEEKQKMRSLETQFLNLHCST